jgi:protein tyrosine phosphatase (PTP) superfamily phosphohydrolase (DUF442 family)
VVAILFQEEPPQQSGREATINGMPVRTIAWLLITVLLVAYQSRTGTSDKKAQAGPAVQNSGPLELSGLHNVFRITDSLFSGSSPEGDNGLRSLKQLGVKTIISVDGSKPDVDRAKKLGLRYVHLPFGYDGIPSQRVLELAKVVRDLPGPFYIHCHHGKHRGPAAAAAVHLCVDENCSVEQALAEMRRAGTDPHYTGLYAVPKNLVRPSSKDLDLIPADFPEIAKVRDLTQFMVEIDAKWENLKLIRAAGWKTPSDHADLDPPHEALQMVEHYREARRLEQVKKRPAEFQQWLGNARDEASALERILRRRKEGGEVEQSATEDAFRKSGECCGKCHAKYRDVPLAW